MKLPGHIRWDVGEDNSSTASSSLILLTTLTLTNRGVDGLSPVSVTDDWLSGIVVLSQSMSSLINFFDEEQMTLYPDMKLAVESVYLCHMILI